jgi:hypothetical protein
MPLARFETEFPASERSHVRALDRAATGIGNTLFSKFKELSKFKAETYREHYGGYRHQYTTFYSHDFMKRL